MTNELFQSQQVLQFKSSPPYHSQLSAATAGLKAFLMKGTDLNIVVRKKSVLQLRR